MFEVPKDEQETKKMRLLIGSATVVVVLVLVIFYFTSQRGTQGTLASVTPVACAPDPVTDLTVLDAKMDKDRTGTSAVWVVHLRNKSAGCAYTAIGYETTYIRSDDSVVAVNKGTLPGTIAPGEEMSYPEFTDILFPTGTTWFRFKITGAKIATQ